MNLPVCKCFNDSFFSGIASFAPKEMGNYQCNIFRDEKHIKGSPFSINVGDKELAHASKVVVSGQTAEAKANTTNYVTIDTSGTGLYRTVKPL